MQQRLIAARFTSIQQKHILAQFSQDIRNKKYQNIVVLSGAGISTGAGIPDYRTKSTGLFANMAEKYNDSAPEKLLSSKYFQDDHGPVYEVCRYFFQKEFLPQPPHRLTSELAARGLLLKNITQNIDGLELKAGLPSEKLYQIHGNLQECFCFNCGRVYDIQKFKIAVANSEQPCLCEFPGCKGVIRPAVVLYGESLPEGFREAKISMKNADCVIIMGTSLKVYPFAGLINYISPSCYVTVFNNERISVKQDLFIEGDINTTTGEILKMIT